MKRPGIIEALSSIGARVRTLVVRVDQLDRPQYLGPAEPSAADGRPDPIRDPAERWPR
ncbi:hypothetical protein PBI_SCHIEBS_23 [Gordonia phage Schiebs]|nr:hypothetical protein PBI_SCHIEBS_23 [Gordonia phage Schiebs]